MILPRLVDAGGGSSRLGGLVQRGLGLFRKSFFKKTPAEPDQGLLVQQQLRCRPIVPPPPEPVLAAVRRGAREILSTYLARNQIQTVAAEMRRRYAFRLMSGPVGFNPGLKSRIAIYGFVGLGFGNAVCNRDNQQPLKDSHTVQGLKELFSPKHNEELVSKKVEEDTFSVVEYQSISSDSDIAIPSDDKNDFEILESSTVLVVAEETDCITKSGSIVSAEVLELQKVVEFENKQQAEICSLVQKVCQENKVLRDVVNTLVEKIAEYQSISDDDDIAILSDESDFEILESSGVLVIAEESDCVTKSDSIVHDEEVLELREVVELENKQQAEINSLVQKLCQENKVLRDVINTQIEKTGGQNPKSNGLRTRDMVCEKERNGSVGCSSLENEREKLRATGGRTRMLKIHRKQRFKRNRIRFMIQRALNRGIEKRLNQLSQQMTKLEEKMRHYNETCC